MALRVCSTRCAAIGLNSDGSMAIGHLGIVRMCACLCARVHKVGGARGILRRRKGHLHVCVVGDLMLPGSVRWRVCGLSISASAKRW